nr:hypothetical protein [Aulosira sp. DedVER01a]
MRNIFFGDGAWGIGHWALGIGRWALGKQVVWEVSEDGEDGGS